MGRVHVRAHGAVPPERFVASLTDFGPGREEIWGDNDPRHLVVHDRGDTWAEVTEGSSAGGVWQRLRYDWSVPDVVTLEVLDSNAFGPGSRWTYRVESDGAGDSHVDLDMTAPLGTAGYSVETLNDQSLWDSAPIAPMTPPNPPVNDTPFLTTFPYLAEPW